MNLNDEKRSSVGRIIADLHSPGQTSPAAHLPQGALTGLLQGALKAPDPSTRDFGERYGYLSVLGEGGQGVVLKATDRVLHRKVALKTIRDQSTPLREEQLRREAVISGGLEHPNIPPTYDLGADETGAPFFVMRMVEGHSLDEILQQNKSAIRSGKKEPFSRYRLLNIFLQVCNAMEYAHDKGVLHLDLKPQNIKLGEFGEVFILDWGFAARMDEVPKFLGGTPIYIAPERLRQEAPNERADVYSMGVLLYRMLTGERPYELGDMSFKEYRSAIDTLAIVPPREHDPSISAELSAILIKSLAKEKEERYRSIHDLATDLQRFLDGVPVTAYHAGPFFRLYKFMLRHSSICLLLGALSFALLGTVILSMRSKRAELARIRMASDRQKQETLRATAQIPFDKAQATLLGQSPRRGEWARGLFSRAIAIDPGFAGAYLERGKLHIQLNSRNEALADFQQVMRLSPSSLMAYYYAGMIQMDEKDSSFRDLAAAERLFSSMQEIDRDNEYSNLGLARLHILAGRYSEALELCDRIEARNPSLDEVHFLRGDIFDNRDTPYSNPGKALAAYDLYLKTPSDKASAYANRGDILFHQGRIQEALTDYNLALQIDPDHVWVLNNRGYLLYSKLKNPAAAMEDFDHAQQVMPEYHWTYMNRGAVFEFLGKWTEAMESYNWAQDLRPQDPSVLQRQAMCLFRQGKASAAVEYLEAAEKLTSPQKRASLYYTFGLIYTAQGRAREALSYLSKIQESSSPPLFYSALLSHIARLELGESPDPAILITLAEGVPDKPWLKSIARCFAGLLTPEQLPLDSLPPEGLCAVRTYLGYYMLFQTGNRSAAIIWWEKSVLDGSQLYNEYVLAKAELERSRTVPVSSSRLPDDRAPTIKGFR